MANKIKLLRNFWKTGLVTLAVLMLVAGGLFLNLKAAGASGASLYTTHLGTDLSFGSVDFAHTVPARNGDFVQLYSEVGTHVSDPAENVSVKVTLPSNAANSGQSSTLATSTTSGVQNRTDNVTWNWSGATCSLVYVSGSTNVGLDRNRDGVREVNGPVGDAITTSGINFGTFTNGVVQITFKARVECATPTPSPSPTPTATPQPSPSVTPSPTPTATPQPSPSVTPSPTPTATPSPTVSPSPTPTVVPSPVVSPSPSPQGGTTVSCPEGFNQQVNGNTIVCVQNVNNNTNNNNNSNSQSQTQNNNQSVNITNTSNNPAVAGVSTIPLKTPETGVGVLGMASMFSAAPIGLVLSRFGKGRLVMKREEEENLSEIGKNMVNRRGKKIDA